jgi:Na+-translocating ferredoxin:NAD+ oxidoreductase RnfG subunit
VILAGSLAYYYSSANAQISSLKTNLSAVCHDALTEQNGELLVFTNASQTLQQQIKDDNSIIAALNSTRPSGYAGTIATLQSEASQDTSIVNLINSALLNQTTSTPANYVSPCEPYS